MSTDEKREDRYEELLQLARDQMKIMKKTAEDLEKIREKLEKLRPSASATPRL